MKLLRLNIISAPSCGGILDGLKVEFRKPDCDFAAFDPICLIGKNASGKSKFLQTIAEILLALYQRCLTDQVRVGLDDNLQFELEYLIRAHRQEEPTRVRATQITNRRNRVSLTMQRFESGSWVDLNTSSLAIRQYLPEKVVGYTSGENETLSAPFLMQLTGVAGELRRVAIHESYSEEYADENRFILISYNMNFQVIVANHLLGDEEQRRSLLSEADLDALRSFRIVIQLAHSSAPKQPKNVQSASGRRGLQLTNELEGYIDSLKRGATCYDYNEANETYTFDYLVTDATRSVFRIYWSGGFSLYSAFDKLYQLNISLTPRNSRQRFPKEAKARHQPRRMPELPDSDKVMRIDRVTFSTSGSHIPLRYKALSDGEHQLGELLGTLSMLDMPNVVFLLDEPESHFNPDWRVKLISRILDLPTSQGTRSEKDPCAEQECLITTHAPFLPSDMRKKNVLIFTKADGKVSVRHPDIETFGATFDDILDDCFGIHLLMSELPRKYIEDLKSDIDRLGSNKDTAGIRNSLTILGDSIEKVFLSERLRRIVKQHQGDE